MLHAGGSSEAEIATPTKDPKLFPNTEMAIAAPEGSAMQIPTSTDRGTVLVAISGDNSRTVPSTLKK